MGWTSRDAAVYVRALSVCSEQASRLGALGVPAKLGALLRMCSTEDTLAHHHLCRALLNFAVVPALRAGMRAAGVADAVRPHAASDDELTAAAAKGVLQQLLLDDDAPAMGAAGDAACVGASGAQQQRYRVFLSHKRTDAKEFARGLYNLLDTRGIRTFLDYECREHLHNLKALVGACDNFVFILTDNIFESEWCLLELKAAVELGLNIIVVRMEGALWLDDTGARTCTHPPPALINSLDEAVRLTLFSNLAISHVNEYYGTFRERLMEKLITPEEAATRAKARRAVVARQPSVVAAAPALAAAPVPRASHPPPALPAVAHAPTHTHAAAAAAAAAFKGGAGPDGAPGALHAELALLRRDEARMLYATLGVVSMTSVAVVAICAMVVSRPRV
jgi:hypothetical protein